MNISNTRPRPNTKHWYPLIILWLILWLTGQTDVNATRSSSIDTQLAQPTQPAQPTKPAQPPNATTPLPSKQPPQSLQSIQPDQPPLKGRVQGIRLLGRDSLGRIGSTIASLKKASLVVMNELAPPQPVMGTSPNVVGSMVIPPVPNPTGVAYLGHGEPHMGGVAEAINAVINYAQRLEDEISITVVPADAPEYAKELWDKIHEISEKLYADLYDLAGLARSEGAPYETSKMEKLSVRIYEKSEAINKLRRRIAGELRNHPK